MELSAIVAFFLAVRSVRLGCVIPFVHGAGILTSFGFFSLMMENVGEAITVILLRKEEFLFLRVRSAHLFRL
jgi:hypothetical protein